MYLFLGILFSFERFLRLDVEAILFPQRNAATKFFMAAEFQAGVLEGILKSVPC